jgi:hypothetical protein
MYRERLPTSRARGQAQREIVIESGVRSEGHVPTKPRAGGSEPALAERQYRHATRDRTRIARFTQGLSAQEARY